MASTMKQEIHIEFALHGFAQMRVDLLIRFDFQRFALTHLHKFAHAVADCCPPGA